MNGAGINRMQLVNVIAKNIPGDQSSRMKKAWKVVKEIETHTIPGGSLIHDTLGVCSKCLQLGWLVAASGSLQKCMNCGAEYLVIEE